MPDDRPVLQVFLSSTSLDLKEGRELVTGAILKLDHKPIAMENFTAQPEPPALASVAAVRSADLLIVVVAHRYGFVPTKALGGDNVRSITWIEVEAAREAKIPVLAFVVDEQAKWTQLRESDRLKSEPEEKHDEIQRAIVGLRNFKDHLRREFTADSFSSEAELALKVSVALHRHTWDVERQRQARRVRVWVPEVAHPLQPAPHFQGRKRLLSELTDWCNAATTTDRVVSLVAVGGTGKTALAQRVLSMLKERRSSGVFVWSFYENPRTDAFLGAAYRYFTEKEPTTLGGLSDRLKRALSGDAGHLLIIDGLERVQRDGTTRSPRGELADPEMRLLLRWLAEGLSTRTRALVTSRFPLVDVHDWKNQGYREQRLDDLEPEASAALLEAFGVRGTEEGRQALAHKVGHHALTVAVLGSYLGRYCGGDPAAVDSFDLEAIAAVDSKTAKLNRVLEKYADQLSADELELLQQLSLFERGIDEASLLDIVIDAKDSELARQQSSRFLRVLHGICELGLVFKYESVRYPRMPNQKRQTNYTAHPFVREFFKNRLNPSRASNMHEAIVRRLTPSLEARPSSTTVDEEAIDQYETLIEHTILAKRPRDAYRTFAHVLGGFGRLGLELGRNLQGFRIASHFSPDGSVESIASELLPEERGWIAGVWGLFAEAVGDLHTALRAHRAHVEFSHGAPSALENLSITELNAGNLVTAIDVAKKGLARARNGNNAGRIYRLLCCLGAATGRAGKVTEAERYFVEAGGIESRGHYSIGAIWEQELQIRTRRHWLSGTSLSSIYNDAVRSGHERDAALCETLLGSSEGRSARDYLRNALGYVERSGHIEVKLRCHELASTICHGEGDYEGEIAEARAGVHLADSTGFGLASIDLRLALANAYLRLGEYRFALTTSHEALTRSLHPDCGYAWGQADALHIQGTAYARLGQRENARERLLAARTQRRLLGAPGVSDIESELARLS